MGIRSIKRLFIAGLGLSVPASFTEIFFLSGSCWLLFALSMLGHAIFVAGLFLIDRQTKGLLSCYYLGMMIISIVLYYLHYRGGNASIILLLTVFFFFLMFIYLHRFTRVSGEALFVRSFYCFMLCFLIGICALKFGGLVAYSATVSFIIGFMALPPLIVYATALISLKRLA